MEAKDAEDYLGSSWILLSYQEYHLKVGALIMLLNNLNPLKLWNEWPVVHGVLQSHIPASLFILQ